MLPTSSRQEGGAKGVGESNGERGRNSEEEMVRVRESGRECGKRFCSSLNLASALETKRRGVFN